MAKGPPIASPNSNARKYKWRYGKGWGRQAFLVLIGIRLGLDSINPIYYDTIKVRSSLLPYLPVSLTRLYLDSSHIPSVLSPSASQVIVHPHHITWSVRRPTTSSTSIYIMPAPQFPYNHHLVMIPHDLAENGRPRRSLETGVILNNTRISAPLLLMPTQLTSTPQHHLH